MHPATKAAQVSIGVLGRVLRGLIPLLEHVHASLPPEPKKISEILEGHRPYTVSVQLRGSLEESLEDVRRAADRLDRDSRVTAQQLRSEFQPRSDEP
ncbi:MAG TPA: hypothetical protein VHQ90_00935 [Thermoanaerobaculia bacterium]|nr:hypothetical protein [Thermoanaerobaculia bacterium]